MVAREPGGEDPETHLRRREERHRRVPGETSSEEEEERVPAVAAGPEEEPAPAAEAGLVSEGFPEPEIPEEPFTIDAQGELAGLEVVDRPAPLPGRAAVGRGRRFRHRSEQARRHRNLKGLLKKHQKQGTEVPESIRQEIEEIGAGLGPEELGEEEEEEVHYSESHAIAGERPSVPPDDLYFAPWRVEQRIEQQEQRQRQQPQQPSQYPRLRSAARSFVLRSRSEVDRRLGQTRQGRLITGRALAESEEIKRLAQQYLDTHRCTLRDSESAFRVRRLAGKQLIQNTKLKGSVAQAAIARLFGTNRRTGKPQLDACSSCDERERTQKPLRKRYAELRGLGGPSKLTAAQRKKNYEPDQEPIPEAVIEESRAAAGLPAGSGGPRPKAEAKVTSEPKAPAKARPPVPTFTEQVRKVPKRQ